MRKANVIDRLLHAAAACNWECYSWVLAADAEAAEAERPRRDSIDEEFWAIVAPLRSGSRSGRLR